MQHLASRFDGPILVKLADSGNVDNIGDISSWLTDGSAEVYFEFIVAPCEASPGGRGGHSVKAPLKASLKGCLRVYYSFKLL